MCSGAAPALTSGVGDDIFVHFNAGEFEELAIAGDVSLSTIMTIVSLELILGEFWVYEKDK